MPVRRKQVAFGWTVLVLVLAGLGFRDVAQNLPHRIDHQALKREGTEAGSISAQLSFLLDLNRRQWLTGRYFGGLAGNVDDDAQNEVANHDGVRAEPAAAAHFARERAAEDSLERAAGSLASPARDTGAVEARDNPD